MLEQNQTDLLRQEIWNKISQLELPGFILAEVKIILDNLNYYKLQNLNKNLYFYIGFLNGLNSQYSAKVKSLFDK